MCARVCFYCTYTTPCNVVCVCVCVVCECVCARVYLLVRLSARLLVCLSACLLLCVCACLRLTACLRVCVCLRVSAFAHVRPTKVSVRAFHSKNQLAWCIIDLLVKWQIVKKEDLFVLLGFAGKS